MAGEIENKAEAATREPKRPLEGVRVLDLTQAANGPFGTLLLSLLGAEIIKLEPPTGEAWRKGPPTSSFAPKVDSITFIQMNHSKKGVTLNLKTELGKEIFKSMVKQADVVVENFGYGVMERLGVEYEILKKINPRIIYASSKGYRSTSPYKNVPSMDPVSKMVSGFASVDGFPGGPPTLLGGPAVGDWGTGLFTALSVLAALRLREKTGAGQKLETSMQEAMVAYTSDWQRIYLEHGVVPEKRGNSAYPPRPDMKMPKGSYEAKDGYVVVHIINDEQRHSLVKVIGREDLAGAPRFEDQLRRSEHYSDIDDIIEEWTKNRTRDEVMKMLSAAGIMCGAVLNTKEVLEDPYLNDRKFFVEVEHPTGGRVKISGLPVQFSDCPAEPVMTAPLLGQHNEEIYGSLLGYSKEELDTLHEQGVI